STVIDMLLTTGGKAVGLGQVWTVLGEDFTASKARMCGCGQTALKCPFWGPVLKRTASLPRDLPLWSRYQVVLEHVAQLFGTGVAIIDSSKLVDTLALLVRHCPVVKWRVFSNIKHVRAFTIPMLDNSRRKSRRRELPEKIFY